MFISMAIHKPMIFNFHEIFGQLLLKFSMKFWKFRCGANSSKTFVKNIILDSVVNSVIIRQINSINNSNK